MLKEEFTELEELVKEIGQTPASAESALLSSIAQEIGRGRELALQTERVAVIIGRGALATLAVLVAILRIPGYGNDLPALVVSSLVGICVLAGLIYTETRRELIRKISQKIRGDIRRACWG